MVVSSNGTKLRPSFIKVGHLLIKGNGHIRHTHTHDDLMSLLLSISGRKEGVARSEDHMGRGSMVVSKF